MQKDGHAGDYRCGAHTISPATRRLLRDGQRVDIEAKVFDLILLLVENRERALGKQEVITSLWGNRPITDAALSQLLYKARRALDDDGERQAVIRTVYGRGLQWVAAIGMADGGAPSTAAETSTAPAGIPIPGNAAPPAPTPAPRRRWWLGAGAALALIAALSAWIVPRGWAPPVPPPRRMALLPIDNATGNAALNWTVRGLPGLIAGLLGDSPDLNVIDPLQVARVWGFTPPKGRSQAEHTRYVTGADILVGGRLAKLPGDIYELTLHLDPGQGHGSDLVLSGSSPGTLGVNAVSQLRRALALDLPATSPFNERPRDAYLAETFARGIDLAMHGDWLGARPYFVLVTKGQPELLQARYLLARAQADTDQQHDADAGYAALLADARRQGRGHMVARILDDQLGQADHRHQDAQALTLATQALNAARAAGDPRITASVLLSAARINARTAHTGLARQQYEQARALIEKTPIRALQPELHNAMAYIANAKGDAAAGITAARAELDADEALGNARGSNIASFNLAYALSSNWRTPEALPLLVRTWNRAGRQHDGTLQVAAGNLLASLLYDTGVYREISPVVDASVQLAAAQDNRYMQARLLDLRAGGEYFGGDSAAALLDSRKASALLDPAQDPDDATEKLLIEAFVAIAADPAAMAGIRRRVDEIAGHAVDPSGIRYQQQLVHALAAAAGGDRQGAHAALDAAAHDPHAPRDMVHAFALQLALASHDDAAAQARLGDFKLDDTDVTADTLRLYGTWSARRGDEKNRRRAMARLDAMRQVSLNALVTIPFDPTSFPH
ncbi:MULTISPECIES: winged helix-turn-helix domain-containing protein [unclassified Rhodanobacter]|uniref:winged helix-turn-helix domain-containing protein n=1 Tax=unclassified Rhodanobacter TaxID=2621553 RepID=UPI001BE03094|nr:MULTISPECIES: winged helix-turn-helix domain-containing protein [unclassified Rhodanobacter]MBT2144575.1 winged helix-turn-helix domain-containing protein [Rhodanobacter sp. LX-99]MBT2148620.1 winged helix-turn-helix domain-containing protein [Rhodanobacter sp. LX-100]